MKRSLTIISLLGLLFAIQVSANDNETKPVVGQKKRCPVGKLFKKRKQDMLEKALKSADVDEATSKKVIEAVKEMAQEKKMKFKNLKKGFKEDLLKRMTDAGLDEDTANKVMENYKAQSKEMRSKIMKKLKGMMEKPSSK